MFAPAAGSPTPLPVTPSAMRTLLPLVVLLTPALASAQTVGLSVQRGAGASGAEWGVAATVPLRSGLALRAEVWRGAAFERLDALTCTATTCLQAERAYTPAGASLGVKQTLGRPVAGLQPFVQPFVGIERTRVATNLSGGAPAGPSSTAYDGRAGASAGLDAPLGDRLVLSVEGGMTLDRPLRRDGLLDSYAFARAGLALRLR